MQKSQRISLAQMAPSNSSAAASDSGNAGAVARSTGPDAALVIPSGQPSREEIHKFFFTNKSVIDIDLGRL